MNKKNETHLVGGFSMIPNFIKNIDTKALSRAEKYFWSDLYDLYILKGKIYASNEYIAQKSEMSERRVIQILTKFEELKLE